MGLEVTANVTCQTHVRSVISPPRSELSEPFADTVFPADTDDQSYELSHGTGADQVNADWTDRFETGNTIDLQSLTDKFGQALSFARLKEIRILNRGALPLEIVGDNPGTETPWSDDKITLPGGGHAHLHLFAPDATAFAVTAGNKTIAFDKVGSGDEQDVDVVLVGVTS